MPSSSRRAGHFAAAKFCGFIRSSVRNTFCISRFLCKTAIAVTMLDISGIFTES